MQSTFKIICDNYVRDYVYPADLTRWEDVLSLHAFRKMASDGNTKITFDMRFISNMLSIDHFVPRSYISNDELWNLTPMNKSLNSNKNNRLPPWDDFFVPFAKYQYYLYSLIFPSDPNNKSPVLVDRFEKCRKNNVNAIWASESLYIAGNSDAQFMSILDHSLKPIYEAAQLQGYEIWKISI